jgi:hypothetical protein
MFISLASRANCSPKWLSSIPGFAIGNRRVIAQWLTISSRIGGRRSRFVEGDLIYSFTQGKQLSVWALGAPRPHSSEIKPRNFCLRHHEVRIMRAAGAPLTEGDTTMLTT